MREQSLPTPALEEMALAVSPVVDAAEVLKPRDSIHVIAEIKRASPSRGRMADIADPAALARTYSESGASAISVLTEQRQFLGSLQDLKSVSAAVSVPLLRKDFIATEYQILEARANGASIVLLIVSGLSKNRLRELKHFAEQLELTAFVETHTREEVQVALELESKLIGINARNLSTFETDRGLFESLVREIPDNITKIAESAVRNLEDVVSYKNAGADAVLVGEALVTGDAASLIRSFVEA